MYDQVAVRCHHDILHRSRPSREDWPSLSSPASPPESIRCYCCAYRHNSCGLIIPLLFPPCNLFVLAFTPPFHTQTIDPSRKATPLFLSERNLPRLVFVSSLAEPFNSLWNGLGVGKGAFAERTKDILKNRSHLHSGGNVPRRYFFLIWQDPCRRSPELALKKCEKAINAADQGLVPREDCRGPLYREAVAVT